MPNFTCDICGGTIKMQANKVGVCQNCGMEYDIEAIRSMISDKPHISRTDNTAIITEDNSLEREALLNYLYDIRVLESLYHKSSNKTVELSEEKANYSFVEEPMPSVHKKADDGIGGRIFLGIIFSILTCKSLSNILTSYSYYKTYERFNNFNEYIAFYYHDVFEYWFINTIFVIPLPLIILSCRKTLKKNQKKEEDYQLELKKNKARVEEWEKRTEELKRQYEEKIMEYDNLLDELNSNNLKLKMLLKKAYSLNIIPMPFRNFEGVCYLYDYLSSSKQSLTEALMQANIENIKKDLRSILEQQTTMIIEQAKTNYKLETIIDYSDLIKQNTSHIAEYSTITALNSEITKLLSAKQLAYEREILYNL